MTRVNWQLFLLAIALMGFVVPFAIGDEFNYTIWSDRDLTRATNLLNDFQFHGAELTDGGYVPGGAYYYLMWILTSIAGSPDLVIALQNVVNISAALIFFFVIRKYASPLFSYSFLAVFATLPIYLNISSHIWNPSLTPFLFSIIFLCTVKVFIEKRFGYLIGAFFAISITAQMHMTFLACFFVFVVLAAIFRIGIPRKYWFMGVGAVIISYSPYIINEIATGLANLQLSSEKYQSDAPGLIDWQPFWKISHILFKDLFNWFWASMILTSVSSIVDAYNGLLFGGLASIKYFLFKSAIETTHLIYFFTVLIGIGVLAKKVRALMTGVEQESEQRILTQIAMILLFFSFIAAFVVFVASERYQNRYMLFAVPGLVMVCAYGVSWVIGFLKNLKNERLSKGGQIVFALILLVHFINGSPQKVYAMLSDDVAQRQSYKTLTTLIDELEGEFGIYGENWVNRVFVLYENENRKWTRYTDLVSAINYLVSQREQKDASTAPKDLNCFMALRPQIGKVLKAETAKKILEKYSPPSEKFEILRTLKGEKYEYFEYRLTSGNCLTSLNNRFLLTEPEQFIAERTYLLKAEGAIQLETQNNAEQLFLIRLDRPFTTYFMVKLSRVDGQLQATLYGNDLRGYGSDFHRIRGGLLGYEIERPSLVFKDKKTGDVVEVPFIDGPMAGKTMRFSPWRKTMPNMPSGEYDLSFTLDDFRAITICRKMYDISQCSDVKYDKAINKGAVFNFGAVNMKLSSNHRIE